MSGNTGSYIASCLFVLLAHVGMLINVFINGDYNSASQVFLLAGCVP